jgi:hypothetical protein
MRTLIRPPAHADAVSRSWEAQLTDAQPNQQQVEDGLTELGAIPSLLTA